MTSKVESCCEVRKYFDPTDRHPSSRRRHPECLTEKAASKIRGFCHCEPRAARSADFDAKQSRGFKRGPGLLR
ncbi:MAG TPA: hypothetical protein VGC77_12680, partial [Rhodopseudomonas sp.]|uniref:hypothetical protein n=1 Tax=Rhodopseudomonas sp. TaxID=1078 RepID=UPI002EDB8F54